MDAGLLAGRVNLVGPWLKQRFGAKAVKIGLDPGLGCPHRQGGTGPGGCAFCPPGGAGKRAGKPLAAQLDEGLASLARRAEQSGRPRPKALAYLQAFCGTFGPLDELAGLYQAVADTPGVDGMIVSTRPDCLDGPRWDLLAGLARRLPLWLELGLQSASDATLAAINRGHDVACFDRAVRRAKQRGIRCVAHVILGLPGETLDDTNQTAFHLAGLDIWGVKMHNLMILEGSGLATLWSQGGFTPWSLESWIESAAGFLQRLPAQVLVHRLAADAGTDRLLAPDWAADKDRALTALGTYLQERDLKQGDLHGRA